MKTNYLYLKIKPGLLTGWLFLFILLVLLFHNESSDLICELHKLNYLKILTMEKVKNVDFTNRE